MTSPNILNIYNDTIQIEYVKDQSDPNGVEGWYKECPECFFYQKKVHVKNIPFIICIQTKWMSSMMLKHSHNNII